MERPGDGGAAAGAQGASGVQALIDRLEREGIDAGRAAAERIVADAEARATFIVDGAREEAERIRREAEVARRQSEAIARDALGNALRDAQLALRNEIAAQMREQFAALAGTVLADVDFVERLILALAARERPLCDAAADLEVLLGGTPDTSPALDDLVRGLAARGLRKGVRLLAGDGARGIRVRLTDEAVELDFTEEAIAELLFTLLQPRVRALLEGRAGP
jgi:V/A-type H+-transporting ATPase subunit E